LRNVKVSFPTDRYHGPWLKPGFDFKSETANNLYYACGNRNEEVYCQMIAQYGDYYTFSNMQIGEGLTEADFERVMEAIDQKISSCLESVKK
jgi:hypothetical protein